MEADLATEFNGFYDLNARAPVAAHRKGKA
jgi:hypothetical protein